MLFASFTLLDNASINHFIMRKHSTVIDQAAIFGSKSSKNLLKCFLFVYSYFHYVPCSSFYPICCCIHDVLSIVRSILLQVIEI